MYIYKIYYIYICLSVHVFLQMDGLKFNFHTFGCFAFLTFQSSDFGCAPCLFWSGHQHEPYKNAWLNMENLCVFFVFPWDIIDFPSSPSCGAPSSPRKWCNCIKKLNAQSRLVRPVVGNYWSQIIFNPWVARSCDWMVKAPNGTTFKTLEMVCGISWLSPLCVLSLDVCLIQYWW